MNTRHTPDTTQHEDPGATPAADLGELWQTLDVLPEAETPEDLLATTIEMVAVDGKHHRPGKSSRFAQAKKKKKKLFSIKLSVMRIGGFTLPITRHIPTILSIRF